jgi:REP element-mobilizing transposase RayT
VRSFKSVATRRTNAVRRTPAAPVWQRGYWESIVRNARHLEAVRRYIANNPLHWEQDHARLDRLLSRLEWRQE